MQWTDAKSFILTTLKLQWLPCEPEVYASIVLTVYGNKFYSTYTMISVCFIYFIYFSESLFTRGKGRVKKYPVISDDFQSTDTDGIYFAGTNTHSLDFRESAGGFIHGFRYTGNSYVI